MQPGVSRERRFDASLKLTIVVFVLMVCTTWLANVWWLCDLASHFWPFFGLVLLPALGWQIYRYRSHWKRSVLLCALILIWSWPLWPYFLTGAIADQMSLRLVVANVNSANRNYQQAVKQLQAFDADVLVLLEINREWADQLDPMLRQYPHARFAVREDNFGIAVLSRHPFEHYQISSKGTANIPTLIIDLEQPRVRIFATHPPPPMGAFGTKFRNEQLLELAEQCRKADHPCLIAGDLNLTPWSPVFRQLLSNGKLSDSAWGQGWQPSWPSWLPLPLLAIDHVLVSEGVSVVDRRIGPGIGSDHYPVIVDLVIPEGVHHVLPGQKL